MVQVEGPGLRVKRSGWLTDIDMSRLSHASLARYGCPMSQSLSPWLRKMILSYALDNEHDLSVSLSRKGRKCQLLNVRRLENAA